MLNILAILIYIGLAFLVYRLILKNREGLTTKKRAFAGALFLGAIPCSFCVMIFELLFDRFVVKDNGTLIVEILTAFFRAALIEEFFKMVFCKLAIKKSGPGTKVECMLLCGMIGAGFGIVEKIFYGGGIILIVNAFLPLHIFFQFLMGSQLFEGKKAKAYFLPFLVHGAWDSLLAVGGKLLDSDSGFVNVIGLVMMLALIVGAVIAEIKVIKKMKKMA